MWTGLVQPLSVAWGLFFPSFLRKRERKGGGLIRRGMQDRDGTLLGGAGRREALASSSTQPLIQLVFLCERACLIAAAHNASPNLFFLARPCSSSFQIGWSVLALSSPIWATRTWRMIVSTTGRGIVGQTVGLCKRRGGLAPVVVGGGVGSSSRSTYVRSSGSGRENAHDLRPEA